MNAEVVILDIKNEMKQRERRNKYAAVNNNTTTTNNNMLLLLLLQLLQAKLCYLLLDYGKSLIAWIHA